VKGGVEGVGVRRGEGSGGVRSQEGDGGAGFLPTSQPTNDQPTHRVWRWSRSGARSRSHRWTPAARSSGRGIMRLVGLGLGGGG